MCNFFPFIPQHFIHHSKSPITTIVTVYTMYVCIFVDDQVLLAFSSMWNHINLFLGISRSQKLLMAMEDYILVRLWPVWFIFKICNVKLIPLISIFFISVSNQVQFQYFSLFHSFEIFKITWRHGHERCKICGLLWSW